MTIKKEVLTLGKHFLTINSTIPFSIVNPITQDRVDKSNGEWTIDCWRLLTEKYFKNNPQFVLELQYDSDLLIGQNFIKWSYTDIDFSSINSSTDLVTIQNSSLDVVVTSSSVDSAVSAIKSGVDNLKASVNTIKTDVTNLKINVSAIKNDVPEIKSDVSTIKNDVPEIKSDVSTIKASVNSLSSTISSDFSNANSYLQSVKENFVPTLNHSYSQFWRCLIGTYTNFSELNLVFGMEFDSGHYYVRFNKVKLFNSEQNTVKCAFADVELYQEDYLNLGALKYVGSAKCMGRYLPNVLSVLFEFTCNNDTFVLTLKENSQQAVKNSTSGTATFVDGYIGCMI